LGTIDRVIFAFPFCRCRFEDEVDATEARRRLDPLALVAVEIDKGIGMLADLGGTPLCVQHA